MLVAVIKLILYNAEIMFEGKECLKVWGDETGYMLTVGCDFPKKVPLENVMALMSLKKKLE